MKDSDLTDRLGWVIIGSVFLISAIAIPLFPRPDAPDNAVQQADSSLEFDTYAIASFVAAGSAMIWCDQLSDAQAKNVGEAVRYMATAGGIPDNEVETAVLLGGEVAKDDLQADGGCGGAHFQDYKRNYFEYIRDPSLAHLQLTTASHVVQPQISEFDRILKHLDSSSNAVCRNFASTLRNTNPGAEDSILRSAEKYGCL